MLPTQSGTSALKNCQCLEEHINIRRVTTSCMKLSGLTDLFPYHRCPEKDLINKGSGILAKLVRKSFCMISSLKRALLSLMVKISVMTLSF